jgi:hypothetical protein
MLPNLRLMVYQRSQETFLKQPAAEQDIFKLNITALL